MSNGSGAPQTGFEAVDDNPDSDVLLAAMAATSRWEAVEQLRAWEAQRLALQPGQRLLDLGCGTGDAAAALAPHLGTAGEVVGIDASADMLAAARRLWSADCPARFEQGDARALAEPDGSFDAARCERALQWITSPEQVVAELARVVRPGGRVSLLDTDWSSFVLSIGDASVEQLVHDLWSIERNRPSHVGRRLADLALAGGLVDVEQTSAVHLWSAWDPDRDPAPPGCFSMEILATELVDAGLLDRSEAPALVETIHDAARRDGFSMSLTIHAVAAARP